MSNQKQSQITNWTQLFNRLEQDTEMNEGAVKRKWSGEIMDDEESSKKSKESQKEVKNKPQNPEKPLPHSSSKESSRSSVETEDNSQNKVEAEDSESDPEDLDEWEVPKPFPKFYFPSQDDQQRVDSNAITSQRFSMVIKYQLPVTVEKQMVVTMKNLNALLMSVTSLGKSYGWTGSAILFPWEDECIYTNRYTNKFVKNEFYDGKGQFQMNLAKLYLTKFVHKWSNVPKKVLEQETGEPATKWFSVQLAWMADRKDLFHLPTKNEWDTIVKDCSEQLEGFSLIKAVIQVKDPVPAVQFLNSVINPAGDWMEEGQGKSLVDTTAMVKNFMGDVEFALSIKKMDCGTYGRLIPRVVTVTVDKPEVAKTQQELATVFSKEWDKKKKIQNGIFTSWIAVPTYSSVTASRDDPKLNRYASLVAQQKSFQKTIRVVKIEGIKVDKLDLPADKKFHLSAEVLSQMEEELLQNGFSPIRRLIYDQILKETKQRLIMESILSEFPDIENDQKQLEKRIVQMSKTIDFQSVIDAMVQDGIQSPYISKPTPSPSKLSLRKMLLSLKSRNYAETKVLVFDSVTVTDEGVLLLTFHAQVAEEAMTVAELLPCFIRHEMHIDPNFYCYSSLIQDTMDGVYNPVSRTGYQARFRNTVLADSGPISAKHRLPEFCREFSASELMKVLKCPVFSNAFPAANDDELASLAESLMTSPPVQVQLNTRMQVDQIMQGAKEIHLDELSGLSGNSFDSKTSQNAFYIEQRAKYKLKESSMKKLKDLAFEKDLTETETNLIMDLGQFNREEFQEAFPLAAQRIWNRNHCQAEVSMTSINKEEIMEDLEEQVLSEDDNESSHSADHSESTEVAGSPSKGTGGPNPGCNN